jgi:DNA repair protein RecO (recombination protein O)
MNWTDEGYILNLFQYAENSSIISILSKNHGHHKGVVYGGTSSKLKKILQIGNKIKVMWKSKSEDKLGYFNVELVKPVTSIFSSTSLCYQILPERNIYTKIFNDFDLMISYLPNDNFFKEYVLWEHKLLNDLGFDKNISVDDEFKILNQKIFYPHFFFKTDSSFNDLDIYNGLLINKSKFLNFIFDPNKLKMPYHRLRLEKFFS